MPPKWVLFAQQNKLFLHQVFGTFLNQFWLVFGHQFWWFLLKIWSCFLEPKCPQNEFFLRSKISFFCIKFLVRFWTNFGLFLGTNYGDFLLKIWSCFLEPKCPQMSSFCAAKYDFSASSFCYVLEPILACFWAPTILPRNRKYESPFATNSDHSKGRFSKGYLSALRKHVCGLFWVWQRSFSKVRQSTESAKVCLQLILIVVKVVFQRDT